MRGDLNMNSEHGGDIYQREIRFDFSSNTNPLGIPDSVKKAVIEAASFSDRYPDPHCRELKKKRSEHENIEGEKIVCGNGADDLIYRIVNALRPRSAVIARPTFSEYGKALREAGCAVREYPTELIPEALCDDTDMLILCSPNNPTGLLYSTETLKTISEKCIEKNIVFLCDECFIDLCENTDEHSAKQFINKNTIILKAFTKTYAMAGLRLGYAIFGSPEIALKVRNTGQFWSVSSIAQSAGIAALGEKKYVDDARNIIAKERGFLIDRLSRFGFTVYPSDANFILFGCDIPLDELLIKEGILIRNCENYSGIGKGYFRVAVRLRSENQALIEAIEKVMKWQKK